MRSEKAVVKKMSALLPEPLLKPEHVLDMLFQVLERTVLMDSWYAPQKLMTAIDKANKFMTVY